MPRIFPDFIYEYYASYWNYVDNMNFTEDLFKHLLTKVNGSLQLTYQGTGISLDGRWPGTLSGSLSLKICGIDIDAFATKERADEGN